MKSPAVFIQNTYLSYEGKVLFENLNLTLRSSKLTCILGPSGVGKSTLLQIIAKLITSKKNKVIFDGNITADNQVPVEQQIAYLGQQDTLLPWFNALDNAVLGAHLRGSLSPEIIDRAKQLFTEAGLTHAEKKYPRELSGGMRQRVSLVRTFLEDKPIVLMDEPFSSLDTITRFQLQTLTSTLLKDRTVLLVTHDPLEALRLADFIYILSGKPATLRLGAELLTEAPRNPTDSTILQHHAYLLQSLTQAKAISE